MSVWSGTYDVMVTVEELFGEVEASTMGLTP